MVRRTHRLRLRRKMREHRRQMETAGDQTDRYVLRRLDRLIKVRRFVAVWLVLIVILAGSTVMQMSSLGQYYQKLRPAAGGVYTEGVVGAFTNANPLYAATASDKTVSKLLFSGLLKYDENNKLTGDLAESWQADERSKVYTVKLKKDLRWSDGAPLTADDVAFTYAVAQNADAQSTLYSSWQGVTIEAKDDQTVVFTLDNSLASFPQSLTTGIIPQHILKDVPMTDMRTTPFNNSKPIGAGPFVWRDLSIYTGNDVVERQEQIVLNANNTYHAGRPKLNTFIVKAFRDEQQMIKRYNDHELNAMVGLATISDDISEQAEAYSLSQAAATMAFFKTTSGVLADKTVRQAMVKATDTNAVRKTLAYSARPVDEPLLRGMLGYDAAHAQFGYDLAAATKQLEEAGWVLPEGKQVREKGDQKLEFALYAESNGETTRVTRELQKQWQKAGAGVKVELQSSADFQVTVAEHGYDVLLTGISVGIDPDVFVYWHSSQADVLSSSRLNFSEYKSGAADEALSSARTRTDESLRAAKLRSFLSAWKDDAPAVGLYQPRVLYVVRDPVYGLEDHQVVSATDRLANVHEWQIRLVKTTIQN